MDMTAKWDSGIALPSLTVSHAGFELALLLAFFLALPITSLAQVATDKALTNADVARMVQAGIPESIVVREIQTSRTDFGTSPAALIELRNHGASERVLGAVLDSRTAPGQSRSEPQPTPHVAGQSAAPGPLRLPTFEADVRFNKTTRGKIKVKHNQITVERSGIPLFSVKWKDKAPAK